MTRDYQPMLELADAIFAPRGYMNGSDRKEIEELRRKLVNKRKAFVYSALRRTSAPELVWLSVAADLNRIEQRGEHSSAAIDLVRTELKDQFARQAGRSALRLFVYRWGWAITLAVLAILKFAVIFDWIEMPLFLS